MKFFTPTYSKIMYIIAGVVLGLSTNFTAWYLKGAVGLLALGIAVWGDRVKAKEDEEA